MMVTFTVVKLTTMAMAVVGVMGVMVAIVRVNDDDDEITSAA